MIGSGAWRRPLGISISALIFFASACSVIAQGTSGSTSSPQIGTIEAAPAITATESSSLAIIRGSPTPSAQPDSPANVFTTATIPVVTVTAVNGNLAIRTGPDVTFDAFGVLTKGQSAPAVARSILDGWVEVEMGSSKAATGWIFANSAYALVNGNVLDLPEIRIVEWPFGSYLRNCTAHQMIVEPGDHLLPPASGSTADYVWFYPGLYTVYDFDLTGRPWITDIKLTQHISLDIQKDGTGQTGTCP
jgi:hypothetical protein